ncbi:MAG: hypothetical protein ACR2RV_15600 [Verrucomicrobiales bacterium]
MDNHQSINDPPWRRLRCYAFDPSLSTKLDTAMINEIVARIPWDFYWAGSGGECSLEGGLMPGPVNEYLEVIDFDPSSGCFYAPVDLNDPRILAQDGLPPSETNPQFHQQMVFAVAMLTIMNFERALGRRMQWKQQWDKFVRRLRIYPHASRQANAFYSPDKCALLFGYFPASDQHPGRQLPGETIFTCLSHDIIAHETTHALLDGNHRYFLERSHRDVLAFHEGFADIVALFQHFTFPELLRHQIAKTRGDLEAASMLGSLALQFGQATRDSYGALRSAIGEFVDGTWVRKVPDPKDYRTKVEPHERGAILVGAVFDAFIAVYKSRVADLLRIYTGGSGRLPEGEIHPDLVNRLASEAAETAQHVLQMCIRALDYCPPVDITFGDYLRALITADYDLARVDEHHYRIAMLEAFRQRGIYPEGVRTISEESLRWPDVESGFSAGALDPFIELLSGFQQEAGHFQSREDAHHKTRLARVRLHRKFREMTSGTGAFTAQLDKLEALTGLVFSAGEVPFGLRTDKNGTPKFEVHSLRTAQRPRPDGLGSLSQIILSIVQTRDVAAGAFGTKMKFRGGCTLIVDLVSLDIRHAISKPIGDDTRLRRQAEHLLGISSGPIVASSPRVDSGQEQEPFALLHGQDS